MAVLVVEFYEDPRMATRDEAAVYGRLLSSVEDTSLSTTVEHVTVPGNACYASVYSDTNCYVEIGPGNQDCGSTRRTYLPSGARYDFAVRNTDTVSYRSVA